MEKVNIKVSHVLSEEQLDQIGSQVYESITEAIHRAREKSKIDSDIIMSKAELCKWLGNISPNYLEELLAKGLPQGRRLSDRKTVFIKSDVIHWLKQNK